MKLKNKIEICEASHHGKRSKNQDRLFSNWRKATPMLAIITLADGMGGHEKGEVAAEIAIEAIKKMFASEKFQENKHSYNRQLLAQAIAKANQEIYKHSFLGEHPGEMGTTLTGAFLVGEGYYVFNVGDSRTYVITREAMHQLTVDHSADQDALAKGIINQEQVGKTIYANALVRALGTSEQVEADIFPAGENTAFPLDEELILLCCSDGLWGKVGAAEIFREITSRKNIEHSLKNLLSLAYLNGSSDNISAAALEWGKFPRRKLLGKQYPAIEKLTLSDKKRINLLKQTAALFIVLFCGLAAGLGYLIKKDYASPPSKVTVLPTQPAALASGLGNKAATDESKNNGSSTQQTAMDLKPDIKPDIKQLGDKMVWRKISNEAKYIVVIKNSASQELFKSPEADDVVSFDLKKVAIKFNLQEKYFFNLLVITGPSQSFMVTREPGLLLDIRLLNKSAKSGLKKASLPQAKRQGKTE